LECAVVLGKRRMNRVHLVDEQDEIGGCMRRISAYPHLGEWGRLVQYRQVQLDKLRNVEVILSTRVSGEEVLTYGAEIVVIATGARWRADGMNGPTQAPIPGADASHVFTPEQVSDAEGAIDGDHVVVYDTDGYFTSVGVAELLMKHGKEVTIITPFPNLGPYLFFTGEAFRINRELREAGVEIIPSHVVTEIDGNQLRGVHAFDPSPVEWRADSVVLVTQREPCDELYREVTADPQRLKNEGIDAVYRIGDCVAPRLIADCVFDGHRLAREIDSDDPSVPLPYLREVASRPQRLPNVDELVSEGTGA
jgi:dimethylamine/trimethylamine dehydrogenase